MTSRVDGTGKADAAEEVGAADGFAIIMKAASEGESEASLRDESKASAVDESVNATELLQCHILDTGYCHTLAAALKRGLPWKPIHCHCLVALMQHPRHGWILWDTGYAPRIVAATHSFPWRFYRWVTPLHIQPELAIAAQLPRFGLKPDDIKYVILSHLHGDHAAGLRDFPNARLVVSRSAWTDAQSRRGFQAVRRALLPALFPPDFAERALFVDDFKDAPLGPLGATHDLFQDGSLRLFPLPGHARGQLGLLATVEEEGKREKGTEGEKTEERRQKTEAMAALSTINYQLSTYLFVADSCMHRDSARMGVLPGRLTVLIADQAAEIAPTIARLHAFALQNPDVIIVPTHCPETYREFIGGKL